MEWISVKDRLPEATIKENEYADYLISEEVLILYDNERFGFKMYAFGILEQKEKDGEKRFFSHQEGKYLLPTHWMPLPAPPEVANGK